MARITVEDCIEKVPSRFELVLLAAERAKQLANGAMLTMERNNDKNPVVALREIAEETISVESLREDLTKGMQKVSIIDEVEEEDLDSILADDSDGDTSTMISSDSDLEDAGYSFEESSIATQQPE